MIVQEAITAYHAQANGELSFARGDFINVFDESERGFFHGEFEGKAGKFPAGMTRKLMETLCPGYQPPDYSQKSNFVPYDTNNSR